MKVISFNLHYNLIEFNYYVAQIENDIISIIELLIDCKIEDFNEEDFDNIFIFETENLTYVFSNFKVSEFYEDGEYLHVTCVK